MTAARVAALGYAATVSPERGVSGAAPAGLRHFDDGPAATLGYAATVRLCAATSLRRLRRRCRRRSSGVVPPQMPYI
jgi:hypothetical protein